MASQLRAVLADPSTRMRRLLRMHFEMAGCTVQEAVHADLGSLLMRLTNVDILVLDLDERSLPTAQAVRLLRRRTPEAVVGGYSILPPDSFVEQLCLDSFVEKPFDVQVFVGGLVRARDRSSVQRDIESADIAL
ncbi:MAG: hypothetical protein M1118_03165 [Chloroflexi bacterium]|nr:hypothetical protein [Chloroflexota bacterium]